MLGHKENKNRFKSITTSNSGEKERVMKKTLIYTLSASSLTVLTMGGLLVVNANAASVGVAKSDAKVAFTTPTTPLTPLDPGTGTNPVTPSTPGDTNTPGTVADGQGLSLDYVPNLNFGTHAVPTATTTYSAWNLTDGTNPLPLYMQVSDYRAANTGWSVSVKEEGNFTSASGSNLAGNTLTLGNSANAVVNAHNIAADLPSTGIVVNTAEQVVFAASANKGLGSNLLDFGGSTANTAKDPDDSAQTVDPAVTLNVLGGSATGTSYSTTLDWTLYNAPAMG